VGTHGEISICTIGKKDMHRFRGKKKKKKKKILEEIWPISAMGEAEIELAKSKRE
jgi:hypothetical protein